MAYQYDEFGNVVGEYETEEERRAREQQELADTAVHTQEIKTYGDGTREVVTKQEIPPELQRQQAAYKQTVAPVAPVSPEQMAYTRQQESGGRANIGYHFPANAQGQRQSTAFGPYGFTQAAYKDIVQQDPSLAKPITEWTPEEHDKAYNTLVGRNQARLTQLGVEPSPGALQLSHLLGPDGAAKFLKTGQVSPQAAAANGGEERLKQIAQGRFAGAQAASSGAAVRPPQAQAQPGVAVATGQGVQGTMSMPETPVAPGVDYSLATGLGNQGLQVAGVAPVPESGFVPRDSGVHIDAYQQVQDDPAKLMALSTQENAPGWLKDRARNRAADLIMEQRQDARAQEELGTLDENKIARLMRERRGEGSRLKGMLFAAFGLTDLANEEKYKLGIGIDKPTILDSGDTAIIKVADNGKAINGINAVTGKELTEKELADWTAQNAPGSTSKTLQTQANQSAAHAMDAMRKENIAAQNRGLPPRYSEEEVLQRGKDVYRQTMNVSRPGAVTSAQVTAGGARVAPGATAATTATAPAAGTGVLDNWTVQRRGEDTKDYAKRVEMRPEEIESAARGLVEGRMKPTEFTGRNNDFRRLAIARAAEIDPKYTPQRYEQVQNVIKRYTSGEDHKTLVNTGTAVNHLLQFKEIAQTTPGNTNVSSWNTFYQNLNKYGNAPEIKSKEAMAGFVAGELVKAASGAQGSMTERVHLEQQLMKANTPAEVSAIVDNSVKLAHGRYSSLKASYEASTGRKDFDSIAGMPREAREAFAKLEGQDAAKSGGYKDPEKEARYQEYLRKKGTAQ